MNLKTVQIKGFRSIVDATIHTCDRFNVLIGKNNAGKSNLLLAINAFFSTIQSKSIATLSSPYSHEQNFGSPAAMPPTFSVSTTFTIDANEQLNIADSVAMESPQVAKAAAQLHLTNELVITVVFNRLLSGPYISNISLTDGFNHHTLLKVSNTSAEHILNSLSEKSTLKEQQDLCAEIPGNIRKLGLSLEHLKGDRSTLRYILSRGPTDRPANTLFDRLTPLLDSSSTLDDFLQAIERDRSVLSAATQEMMTRPLKHPITTFSGESAAIPQYVTDLISHVASHKVLYLTERRAPIGRQEARRLLELKVRRGGTDQLKRIQEVVIALLGVKIDAFQSESERKGDSDAELDVDNFLVQVNGAGVREALRLILDYEFERPKVLLVEEPEIHLHPALESSMMRYLKACGMHSQVFITTHSTNFLDTAGQSNIYLVSRSNGTRVELLEREGIESRIPKEIGLRLSSLFMFDRLVFVEGPSDEDVLREFASTLELNLANSNVGFIPMGGIRNLAYFAADATIDFLAKRQVQMWFIIDRDERDDPELKQLSDRLAGRATLVSLTKRELENYLILPLALSKFIELKRRLAGEFGATPTADEVGTSISECADQLKHVAIERRVIKYLCVPQFPNRKRLQEDASVPEIGDRVRAEFLEMKMKIDNLIGRVDEYVTKATSEVEQNWQSSKLDIVPGDILIDSVCKRYGVRFQKERDSTRLAAMIDRSDIHDEFVKILRKITTED